MIGSLKSMSFLEPYSWYDKLLARFKKTQKVNLQEQYEKYNVRVFDFHVAFVGNSKKAVFKYDGVYYYTFSIYPYLNYLNLKGDTYVRIVLEDDGEQNEMRFREYCKIISTIYLNIKFIGGYRERNYKKLYNFNNKYPSDLTFYKRVDRIEK